MKLRDYQINAVFDIKSFFKQGGKHALVQAPTGAGKTVIFTYIALKTAEKQNKVLILTDRIELIGQTERTLNNIGLQTDNIIAGAKYYNVKSNVYLGMSQTLRRRIKDPYWLAFLNSISLIIIDEAHKQEFNYLFEKLDFLDKKHVIGFSATPIRSGKMRQLALDYEKIINTTSVQWLVDHNFLVDAKFFTLAGAEDFNDVKIDAKNGDYNTGELLQKFNQTVLYSGVVTNWKRLVNSTKTLVFCVNIEHAIKTALEFQKHDISVKYIVSDVAKPKYPKQETDAKIQKYNDEVEKYNLYQSTFKRLSGDRKEIFNKHKKGDFKVLVNAGIATTGYDDPTLETIILNRATISLSLYLQMIGRGARIFENKSHFNILDFGGNMQRFGNYTQDREWSLWHSKSNGSGVPPVKSCGYYPSGEQVKNAGFVEKGCSRPILASYTICPFCGFKYPKKKAKEIKLKEIPHQSTKVMTPTELYAYSRHKGYKIGWFWRQLYYRKGFEGIKNFANEQGWSSSTLKSALKYCSNIK